MNIGALGVARLSTMTRIAERPSRKLLKSRDCRQPECSDWQVHKVTATVVGRLLLNISSASQSSSHGNLNRLVKKINKQVGIFMFVCERSFERGYANPPSV